MLALRLNIISLINIHIYSIYILIHLLNFVFLCNIVLLGKNGNKIVCLTFVYIEKPIDSLLRRNFLYLTVLVVVFFDDV